jgi:hypothetical protein|tara:strand:- start:7302 stop:7559 length:258 start_codon:yes stop_codon:yes gene_type:complete
MLEKVKWFFSRQVTKVSTTLRKKVIDDVVEDIISTLYGSTDVLTHTERAEILRRVLMAFKVANQNRLVELQEEINEIEVTKIIEV